MPIEREKEVNGELRDENWHMKKFHSGNGCLERLAYVYCQLCLLLVEHEDPTVQPGVPKHKAKSILVQDMKIHLKTCHKEFQCQVCHHYLPNRTSLLEHNRLNHVDSF